MIKYDNILVDSTEVTGDFKDINFLLDKNLLIKLDNGNYKVNFVGEVITPNSKIMSIPKNFNQSDSELIVSVLKKFKSIKKDGKVIIENRTFTVGGEIESDIYHFKSLKKFFTDRITYDFITPKKKIKKHTSIPMAAQFDVVETEMNISKYGGGLTYKLKDKSNKNWKLESLSNIYYTTLSNLMNEFGSESDREEFKSITDFYKFNGHQFNYIKINEDKIVKQIEINDVSPVHLPIKSHLLNYYKSKSVKEKWKIRVFYSQEFEYVWEFFCKSVLKHNHKFKEQIEWVESKKIDKEGISKDKVSNPDVFSDFKERKFIADCKYYREVEADYEKEMYRYNISQGNKYPVLILVPSSTTEYYSAERHENHELLIVNVSLKEVMTDMINETNETIENIWNIISENSDRALCI
jgi:hypothetical protein